MIFNSIISGLKEFNSNAWDYVGQSIEDNQDDIIYINQSRIIDKGIDGEDKKITNKQKAYPVYSAPYTKKKKRLGLYDGHVNLYLSGSYLGSYQLKTDAGNVDIFVDATQADLDSVLKGLYGVDIQGLTSKEWDIVVEKYILPELLTRLSKIFI